MAERHWGWRQWCLQILIVLLVTGLVVPLALYGSSNP
jgi:hypothetical protein